MLEKLQYLVIHSIKKGIASGLQKMGSTVDTSSNLLSLALIESHDMLLYWLYDNQSLSY